MPSKNAAEIVKFIYEFGGKNMNIGLERLLRTLDENIVLASRLNELLVKNKRLKQFAGVLGIVAVGSTAINVKQHLENEKLRKTNDELKKEQERNSILEIEKIVKDMSDDEIVEAIEEVVEIVNKEKTESNTENIWLNQYA